MSNWLRWLLGLAVACVLLGVWASSSTVVVRSMSWVQDRDRAELHRLYREQGLAFATYARTVRALVLQEAFAEGDRLIVRVGGDTAKGLRERLERRARAELAPVAEPRVPLGVLSIPVRDGASSGAGVEYFASRDPARPYCAAVLDGPAAVLLLARRVDREAAVHPLGPCRLWGRYGMPGDSIAEWLQRGALYLARDAEPPRPLPDSAKTRQAFGARRARNSISAAHTELETCLAGHAVRCRQALLHPFTGRFASELPKRVVVGGRSYWWDDPFVYGGLLAMLEAEHGPERFARFWTSSADVETAFRTAFGESLEDWGMRTLQGVFGRAPTGPRLAATTLLLSFVTLGLLVAAAIAVVRRRTLG